MVFNTTFYNISVISWWSILLVEETDLPIENHWPSPWAGFELETLMVIGTDCTCSCEFNCHTIMTVTASYVIVICGPCLYKITSSTRQEKQILWVSLGVQNKYFNINNSSLLPIYLKIVIFVYFTNLFKKKLILFYIFHFRIHYKF